MNKEKFVFIGNSLVADFDWQARMPFFDVTNLGIPGETTQDLLEMGRIAQILMNALIIEMIAMQTPHVQM